MLRNALLGGSDVDFQVRVLSQRAGNMVGYSDKAKYLGVMLCAHVIFC